MNLRIGLPELLFVLVVIVLPLWAIRRFPLPANRAAKYVLLVTIALLFAVLAFNYATTYRAVD
jgi:hypothetical protein